MTESLPLHDSGVWFLGQLHSRAGVLQLFEFLLGVALVGVLFWVFYHLEGDWPQRLVHDALFRQEALLIVFAFGMAYLLSGLF